MSKDVAAWAFIEQEVLALAEGDGSLRHHARRVEKMYGLVPEYLGTGLLWQTRALSLLYMLVLFPREYWMMEQSDPIYREIEERWSLNGINVLTDDKKHGHTIYGFIHRLRNALAHANIAFHGDDIEFADFADKCRGKEVYRARVSRHEVQTFLKTVGSIMANRRNWAVH